MRHQRHLAETARALIGVQHLVEHRFAARSFRLDDTGRLWAGVGDGVHCFDPDGTLIGKLHLPEDAANLTFGGLARNRLFITATTSLYSIRINVNGAARYRLPS